jgi:ribosomal protein L37AE/L43A
MRLNDRPAMRIHFLSTLNNTAMEFVLLRSFDNYIEAHMVMGRLEEEGIHCWLKDEHIVTINPILSNAVGGIKLMVPKEQEQEAQTLLQQLNEQRKASFACPKCSSHNIEFINTPRKAINWASAIIAWFVSSYAIAVVQVWHCFDCNAEFTEPVDTTNEQEPDSV